MATKTKKKREEKTSRNNSIKKAVKSGKSMRKVAKYYDLSGKRVFDIVHRKSSGKSRGK